MIFKMFTTLLMVVAFIHHSVSITYYGQACNIPGFSCIKLVCQPAVEKDDFECIENLRIWNSSETLTAYWKHLRRNEYAFSINSVEVKNTTLVITKKGDITKIILKSLEKDKEYCLANQLQINNKQIKEILKFCTEEGMQLMDNRNC